MRIRVEHTIGVLKARFASLRLLPNSARMNTSKMEWCYAWIAACVVLHNLLLGFNDPWIPEEGLVEEILEEEAYEIRSSASGRLQDGEQDNGQDGESDRKREELFSEFLRLVA